MRSLLITSRRERSTGLLHPSVFHTPAQRVCIPGTALAACNAGCSLPPLVGWVRQSSFTITRGTRGRRPTRLRPTPPLWHALVLVGFPRKVSHRPRGLLLSTPPFSERNQTRAYTAHDQMRTVCHLKCLGRSQRRAGRIIAAAIPANEPCLRMLAQPLGQAHLGTLEEQIHDPVLLQVNQDGAIRLAAAQRSGKGMALPPFPPPRTGLVPFDTSGSSLLLRRCYPTGFLNSQSGRMELVMTCGMQQEAI
jgi:hypothetical protein